jgi:ribonuclease R
MHGLVVNVQLLEYPDDDQAPVGRVIEILGDPEAFGIDVEITIRKFQIPHEFPPDVLLEARDARPVLLEDRRDFRHLPIVTIDGETARDFDDAILVRRLPNQNFELQVHIADVSHYVQIGSAIDREARQRGTSVYFPDRAVPMLPVELSADLCSLRPGEDRAVLSAILELTPQGDTVKQEFCRGLICSAARLTYTKVHVILEGPPDNPLTEQYRTEYAHLRPELETARDLALALMAKRRRRGSIDFDLPEPLIEFSPEGEMTGILRHPRNIAHRLIEELMLAANEAVAAHLERLDIPSLYRIHDPPNPAKVLEFQEAAAEFGYKLDAVEVQARRFQQVKRTRDGRKVRKQIDVVESVNTIPSSAYQKLVAQIEGKPEERIISYLLLRSMKQARYSAENKGHYALAADSYTHFTSPIRRYPDLIVHRLLTSRLLGLEAPYATEELVELAEHCSMTERRAADAERELVEWKKAKFMNDRIGQEFDALITNTSRWGCFVELNDLYVEGLIPIESLGKEKFGFEERTRRIVGHRSGREFRIGQPVRVLLERVDEMEKRLQFLLVESPNSAPRRSSTRKPRY